MKPVVSKELGETLNFYRTLANWHARTSNWAKTTFFQIQYIKNYPVPSIDDYDAIYRYDLMVYSAIQNLSKMTYSDFMDAYPISPFADNSAIKKFKIMRNTKMGIIGDYIKCLISEYPNYDIETLYNLYLRVIELEKEYDKNE